MKKRISVLILATVMLFSVGCVSAAESYLPNSEGVYSIDYENAKIVDGEQYGFVVVQGLDNAVLDLSEDNLESVLYIGQAEGQEGNISFGDFILRGKLPTEEGFTGGTAFIGGKGFDTATTVGTLEVPSIPVTAVTLDKTEATIKAGNSITLAATVTPDNATNKTVIWTSSDSTVASVDANGVVKAENKSATPVTITATAGDKTATCTVTVIAAPGDANGDSKTNLSDAYLICRKIAGHNVTLDESSADVNGDDKVNLSDAYLICRKIAGHDVTLK